MSGHTPGPWIFDNDWRRWPTVFGSDGIKVAIIEKDKTIDSFVYELPERFANARLIAAAPDMLAALKDVVAVADRKTDEFDRARAAIAKAEGPS